MLNLQPMICSRSNFYVWLFSIFSIFFTHHSKYYIFYINFLHFQTVEDVAQRVDKQKKGKGRKNVGGGSKECLRCVNTWYKKSQKNNRIHYWIPKPYFGVSMFKKSSIFYEYIDDPKSPPTSLEKCLNMPI